MSSIPSSEITVRFEGGGGDPAGGDRGDAIMSSVLDTLRQIQVNVGAINNNVRAILETLRTIASRGVRATGGGGGGGGRRGGGGGGAGDGPASGFPADILEYRNRMMRSPGLRITDIASEQHRALLGRYHDLSERAGMSRREMREAMSLRRLELLGETQAGSISAESAREIYRAEREAQRAAARQARTDQMAGLRTARNRMTGLQQSRIDALRQQRAQGVNLMFTPEELAIINNQVSPSGLPGTRAYHREVRRLGAPPAIPGAAPAAPAAPGPFAGFMNVVTVAGRILSVIHLVSAAITKIVKMLASVVDFAKQQRAMFANVSAPIAMMQAQVNQARLMDMMSIGNMRTTQAFTQAFTSAELLNISAMRYPKMALNAAGNLVGAMILNQVSNAGLLFEGAVTGNASAAMAGFTGLMNMSPIGNLINQMLGMDKWYQNYIAQRINGQRQVNNGIFIDVLRDMTGGRFDTNKAYSSRRANSENWWDYRFQT
jgi:hypothetical protein